MRPEQPSRFLFPTTPFRKFGRHLLAAHPRRPPKAKMKPSPPPSPPPLRHTRRRRRRRRRFSTLHSLRSSSFHSFATLRSSGSALLMAALFNAALFNAALFNAALLKPAHLFNTALFNAAIPLLNAALQRRARRTLQRRTLQRRTLQRRTLQRRTLQRRTLQRRTLPHSSTPHSSTLRSSTPHFNAVLFNAALVNAARSLQRCARSSMPLSLFSTPLSSTLGSLQCCSLRNAALQRASVPCSLSRDSGGFLCILLFSGPGVRVPQTFGRPVSSPHLGASASPSDSSDCGSKSLAHNSLARQTVVITQTAQSRPCLLPSSQRPWGMTLEVPSRTPEICSSRPDRSLAGRWAHREWQHLGRVYSVR